MKSKVTKDDDGEGWVPGTGSDTNDDDCSVLRWVSMLLEYNELSRNHRYYAFSVQADYDGATYSTNQSNTRGSRKR